MKAGRSPKGTLMLLLLRRQQQRNGGWLDAQLRVLPGVASSALLVLLQYRYVSGRKPVWVAVRLAVFRVPGFNDRTPLSCAVCVSVHLRVAGSRYTKRRCDGSGWLRSRWAQGKTTSALGCGGVVARLRRDWLCCQVVPGARLRASWGVKKLSAAAAWKTELAIKNGASSLESTLDLVRRP